MFLISPILGLISVIESFAKYKNLNKWIVITVTVIVFFFLGYSVRLTNVNADLGQYFSWFSNYENMTYSFILSEAVSEKNVFVLQQLMLTFFSKLHNENLFTGFIVAVFYACYMYIVTTYLRQFSSAKFGFEKKRMAINFGLLIISFGWVLTSVRNPMANALIAVAIFRDLYMHKNGILTLIFYFLGLSMHIAVLPIIVCRILVGIIFSRSLLRRCFSIILGVILMLAAVDSNITSTANDKFSMYGLGSSGGGFAEYARSSFYYQVNSLFLLWLMVLNILLIMIVKKQHGSLDRTFRRFLTTVSVLAIISYFSPAPLIDRYGMFVEIFMPVVVVNVDFRRIAMGTRKALLLMLAVTVIFGFLWQLAFLKYQIDILSFMFTVIMGWLSLL
ncbi:hypothetical protein FD15_GL001524 [Liquorilactobacillus sucicola DSM 21376 = JCM 15457]|uniref:EpsG family protein n=3 Tax=Liquorilactobacillus sucicola TaxID=519050 RepID=A0A0R2DQH8_9LACO|nr:hypothetical protein FD15_GL001524 [Liquorilactobacillus sucicola DSM 21376 = JCM 15457]